MEATQTGEQVFNRVAKIAKEEAEANWMSDQKTTIEPTTEFIRDLGFDSLDMVEFVMSLEDEFGVEIDDETFEAAKIVNVSDVVKFLTEQCGVK